MRSEGRVERSGIIISPTNITNNLPFVASLIAGRSSLVTPTMFWHSTKYLNLTIPPLRRGSKSMPMYASSAPPVISLYPCQPMLTKAAAFTFTITGEFRRMAGHRMQRSFARFSSMTTPKEWSAPT